MDNNTIALSMLGLAVIAGLVGLVALIFSFLNSKGATKESLFLQKRHYQQMKNHNEKMEQLQLHMNIEMFMRDKEFKANHKNGENHSNV